MEYAWLLYVNPASIHFNPFFFSFYITQEVKKMLDICSFAGPMARFVQRHDCVDVFAIETRNGVVYDDEERISYEYSDIYPFVDCSFMGIRTKCPKNSKAVLKRNFGNSLKPTCKCVDGIWTIGNW